jgi:hypothetical protein
VNGGDPCDSSTEREPTAAASRNAQRLARCVDERDQVAATERRLRQDTEGWPDRRRQPRWTHGRERRHLFAQAPQRGGERRFVKRCAQAMLPTLCAARTSNRGLAQGGRRRQSQRPPPLLAAQRATDGPAFLRCRRLAFAETRPKGRCGVPDDEQGRTHPGRHRGSTRLAPLAPPKYGTRRAQVSSGALGHPRQMATGRCDPEKGGLDPNAPELALFARATASDPLDQRRLRAALLGAPAQEAASDRVTHTRAGAALARA